MRIVHVNTARTWRGGERQVLLLAAGLQERGHAVLLICQPRSPLSERARRAGLAVSELVMRGEWDLWASARMAACIRQFRADVVHLHTAHAHTLGLLAGLWTRMPPRVVSRRVDFAPHRDPLSRLKYLWRGQMYAAVSGNVRDVLVAAGIPSGRVRIIHSGVPAAIAVKSVRGSVRSELGIAEGRILVVSVAALAPHKDHSTLLQAARKVVDSCPRAHFLLVGDGERATELRAEIAALGLEGAVTMAGFRDDVDAILRDADVFVSSSRLEGLGTSILDAMAAGLPVVATRAGGIPEMVRDGREGRLVPVREPAALAEAIVSVLKSERERKDMGKAARERAASFDIRKTIAATEALYRDLVPSRDRASTEGEDP